MGLPSLVEHGIDNESPSFTRSGAVGGLENLGATKNRQNLILSFDISNCISKVPRILNVLVYTLLSCMA